MSADSKKKLIVAIDGPAGSGKSTVTHLLAKRLAYLHIDTGALYRAIALKAQQNGISSDDGEALGKLVGECKLEFKWSGMGPGSVVDRNLIFLDGKDVSGQIRTPEISMAASKISAHASVRQALLGLQRDMGSRGGVVLEGRDIGTVVFPNADVKFYLTASVDSRARRRMVELEDKGIFQEFAEVKKQVIDRDRGDMERKAAPLKKADDAIEIDTTQMTVEEVVDKLESIVKQKQNR